MVTNRSTAHSLVFSLIFTATVLKSPYTFAKYIIPISYELGEVDKEFLNNFKNFDNIKKND